MSRNARNGENGENGEKSPACGDFCQNCQFSHNSWRFELDAKSGPTEAGDFGENRQRAGNNGDKCQGPFVTGNFGENGEIGKNRQKCM